MKMVQKNEGVVYASHEIDIKLDEDSIETFIDNRAGEAGGVMYRRVSQLTEAHL